MSIAIPWAVGFILLGIFTLSFLLYSPENKNDMYQNPNSPGRKGCVMRTILLAVFITILVCGCGPSHRGGTPDIRFIQGPTIKCGIDEKNGSLCIIESNVGGKTHMFMNEPITVSIRNEYTNAVFRPSTPQVEVHSDTVTVHSMFSTTTGQENTSISFVGLSIYR